jgi:tyrosyl-tRNA synthetase
MDIDERMSLVKRNLQELIGEDELRELLKAKETPVVYLGVSITGRPHVGYFVWVNKMLDLMKAGFKVKVLLADLHGALDNTPWELLDKRYSYYEKTITGMFESLGADLNKLEFVKGSDFQLTKEYQLDLLKLASFTTVNGATKAASEVVKQGDSPKLSGLIYPLMQALDEEYLQVDAQYGGIDQRKILVFAREFLPKIGYKPRIEIMTPLIPGFQGPGGKMSASIAHSKIDLLDDDATLKSKMKKAYCPEGEAEGNGVLAFVRFVILPVLQDKGESFTIERPEKFGGNLEYDSYQQLESDFTSKKLHPVDLKNGVVTQLNRLLSPIREKMAYESDLLKQAYPEE